MRPKSKDDLCIRSGRTSNVSLIAPLPSSPIRTIGGNLCLDDASVRSATSLSSTFTAERAEKTPISPLPVGSQHSRSKARFPRGRHHGRSSGRRLRVGFCESRNQWHDSNLTDDDVDELWFREEDYQSFFASMVEAVTAINAPVPEAETDDEGTLHCAEMLGQLIKACQQSPRQHHQQHQQQHTSVISRDDKRRLRHMFKRTPDLVGLERAISPLVTQDRSSRRAHIVDLIDDLQCCEWPDHETEAQRLCEASMSVSRTHRLFARHVAMSIAPSSSSSSSSTGQQQQQQDNKHQQHQRSRSRSPMSLNPL